MNKCKINHKEPFHTRKNIILKKSWFFSFFPVLFHEYYRIINIILFFHPFLLYLYDSPLQSTFILFHRSIIYAKSKVCENHTQFLTFLTNNKEWAYPYSIHVFSIAMQLCNLQKNEQHWSPTIQSTLHESFFSTQRILPESECSNEEKHTSCAVIQRVPELYWTEPDQRDDRNCKTINQWKQWLQISL